MHDACSVKQAQPEAESSFELLVGIRRDRTSAAVIIV